MGDRRGIVIMGNAPMNKTPATIKGRIVIPFGGFVANDELGVLRYAWIDLAGRLMRSIYI